MRVTELGRQFFVAAAIVVLAGCDKASVSAPDSPEARGAVRKALANEIPEGKTLADLSKGQTFTAIFDEGRQFLVAEMTAPVAGTTNCGFFYIKVNRPSRPGTQYSQVAEGGLITVCQPLTPQ